MDVYQASKAMARFLRHAPDEIGLKLEVGGYVKVSDLLNGLKRKGYHLSINDLIQIVNQNNKQRFGFNDDMTKIRANQGHSIPVDLQLEELNESQLPEFLYHGTGQQFVSSIMKDGIKKMNRHHVHLSKDQSTALAVGKRHGIPKILTISAKDMLKSGNKFFKSENGVYLTEYVNPIFIKN
jgi:putative RNA 2'-phosphotransferase